MNKTLLCLSRSRYVLFCAAIHLLLPASGNPADKYFRSDAGIANSAVSLPDNLGASERLRWRVALDSGHSTPILHAGKLFLTTWGPETKELATVALDAESGRLLWRSALTPERVEQTHAIGNPATGTIACDGQRVFAFFGSAGVFCHDVDGHKLWEQRLGPFRDEYGAGSSPILCDGKIILNQDHDTDSFLIALNSTNGQVLWKAARPDATAA